ncbi:MAG: hypothetical protein ABI766_11670 [Gemmatimonadales bacterium]
MIAAFFLGPVAVVEVVKACSDSSHKLRPGKGAGHEALLLPRVPRHIILGPKALGKRSASAQQQGHPVMSAHAPLYPHATWELAAQLRHLPPGPAEAFRIFSRSVFAESAEKMSDIEKIVGVPGADADAKAGSGG